MFGLKALFSALSRCTTAFNNTADLVELANDKLRGQLLGETINEQKVSALPSPVAETNGKAKKKGVKT
jgi:hypothetical protein